MGHRQKHKGKKRSRSWHRGGKEGHLWERLSKAIGQTSEEATGGPEKLRRTVQNRHVPRKLPWET